MKRWTIWNETLFRCGVACCSVVAVAMAAMFWPVLFIPGPWDDYTCWESDEEC